MGDNILDYVEEYKDDLNGLEIPEIMQDICLVKQLRRDGYRFGDAYYGYPVARHEILTKHANSICANYLRHVEHNNIICDPKALRECVNMAINERGYDSSGEDAFVIHMRAGDKHSAIGIGVLDRLEEFIEDAQPERVVINIVFYFYGQFRIEQSRKFRDSVEAVKLLLERIYKTGYPVEIRSTPDADSDLCYMLHAKHFMTLGSSAYAELIAEMRGGVNTTMLNAPPYASYLQRCKNRFKTRDYDGNAKFGKALYVLMKNEDDSVGTREIAQISARLLSRDGSGWYGHFHQNKWVMPFDGNVLVYAMTKDIHDVPPMINCCFDMAAILKKGCGCPPICYHGVDIHRIDFEEFSTADLKHKILMVKTLIGNIYPSIRLNPVEVVLDGFTVEE